MIQVVFAVGQAQNGVHPFGLGDGFPWPHIPSDLARFAANTTSQTGKSACLMGRKTFESLPCNLKNRDMFVMTRGDEPRNRKGQTPTGVVTGSLEIAATGLSREYDLVSIIGGSELVVDSIKWADRVIVTEIANERNIMLDYDVGIKVEEMDENYYRRTLSNVHRFRDGAFLVTEKTFDW